MKRSSYLRLPEHEINFAAGHNPRGAPSEFGSPQQRQKMRDLAKEWNKPMATWRYEDVARAMAQATPELPVLPNFMSPNAAGSLLSTATEYARFMIRLMDKPPQEASNLAEATRREMLTPQQKINSALAWGLGIGLEQEQGEACFWHWGGQWNIQGIHPWQSRAAFRRGGADQRDQRSQTLAAHRGAGDRTRSRGIFILDDLRALKMEPQMNTDGHR